MSASGPMPRGEKSRRLADEMRRGIAEMRWPDGRLPTEQELAAEQGVSVNTVRRAVALLIAEGLVYRRQGSGTYIDRPSTTSAKSGLVIGVCVPSLTYYFPRLVAAIESEIGALGGQMLLTATGYSESREQEAVQRMLATGATGLVMAPELPGSDPRAALSHLQSLPVPVVTVERWLGRVDDQQEFVCTNRVAGGYAAAEHLMSLGHTAIAYTTRKTPHGRQLATGMEGAMSGAGLEVIYVEAPDRWEIADAAAIVDRIVERGATAVVCVADREAALLVTAARERGIDVPNELSVVSYDDEVADLADVPLTAVAPAKAEVGVLAVRALARRIAEPNAPVVQQFVLPRLVVRGSTAPFKA